MVHQTGQELLKRPPAEFFQNITYVFDGDITTLARARIEKLAAVDLMLNELLRFQTAKNGAHRGVGERSVFTDGGADFFAGGRAVVSCHDLTARLLRTIDVTGELLTGAERNGQTRLCLTAIGNQVAIALGNRLVLTRSDGLLTQLELPGQVTGLFPTLPHTRAGLAVMLEHGAVLHWLGAPGLIDLDRDLASPQGVFVPAGPLVLLRKVTVTLPPGPTSHVPQAGVALLAVGDRVLVRVTGPVSMIATVSSYVKLPGSSSVNTSPAAMPVPLLIAAKV